jgi:hypothetical protein
MTEQTSDRRIVYLSPIGPKVVTFPPRVPHPSQTPIERWEFNHFPHDRPIKIPVTLGHNTARSLRARADGGLNCKRDSLENRESNLFSNVKWQARITT